MSFEVSVVSARKASDLVRNVAVNIEHAFSQIGDCLGRGHGIFQELNEKLSELSHELSGTMIDGAAAALRDIAGKLSGLAEDLPAESELLNTIDCNVTQASAHLKSLIKLIKLIAIIARSARIEAASINTNQADFLDFTQEAFDLAVEVQSSIEACARDQGYLSVAISEALRQQQAFERRYRGQLVSVSAELVTALAGMEARQAKSLQLTHYTRETTERIATSVSSAILSLQAGDSTRQRLEHVCAGLQKVAEADPRMAPSLGDTDNASILAAPLIRDLQAAQLEETTSTFNAELAEINSALTTLASTAAIVVDQGHSFYGSGSDDMPSFLDSMKQALALASALVSGCEHARRSVDDALAAVEKTLGKFQLALSSLSEVVVDMTLIGMNAALKAGHLGAKGRAFVVIADELKLTADCISDGANQLGPVLENIDRSTRDLKHLLAAGESSQIHSLQPSIILAIEAVEAGDQHLGRLMSQLNRGGAEFGDLMGCAQRALSQLSETTAVLPTAVTYLKEGAAATILSAKDLAGVEKVFDELHAQYTMNSERQVHAKFAKRFGLSHSVSVHCAPEQEEALEDAFLF